MAHKHSLYDTDTHFSINPITRGLKNESSSKTSVIQYDHNSERFTFELPRFVEGHDMSICNAIQVHYLNIDSKTKEQNAGVYDIDDMQISPDADDMVICSWLISQNATQLVGSLNFLIRFACIGDDGTIEYVWNTAIFSGISVSTGIYNGDVIIEEYSDILAQWEARITMLENGGVSVDVVSPTVNVDKIDDGHRVEVTDADGTKTFDVMNGKDGTDGDDGVSPTVSVSKSGKVTTITITDKSGKKTATINDGQDGVSGKDGYTPVKGVDYFDGKDGKDGVDGTVQETPLFANDESECTDTTKVYVLPDGNVYAYMTKTVVKAPTNQIEHAVDSSKQPYNGGKGYKDDTRISLSSGESSQDGYTTTGFIEVKQGDTIRFANINTSSTSDNIFIVFYDASFARVGYLRNQAATDALKAGVCVLDDHLTLSGGTLAGTEYFRLSMLTNENGGYLITVNEPLEPTTTVTKGWGNTGHKFVPADYEEDILDLKERMSIVEAGGGAGGTVESYVEAEARRVAKNVYAHQNANTFTFLAVSDAHYLAGDANIVASVVHAGQGMDLVRKNVNVDFAVCLGDNGSGSGKVGSPHRATIEMGIAQVRAVNAAIDSAFRGIPNFRTVGNHDSLVFNYTFNGNDYLDASELFPLYGAYNRGAVFHEGNRDRGYCYRDFEDWKLRVICLNTSDIQDLEISDDTRAIYVSATQGQWFAETLDLSGKVDAAEWSILILSHAPLDHGPACIYLCDILEAYVKGEACNVSSYEGTGIVYDYAGKNAARIIGNCHGHNHNFQVSELRKYVGNNTTEPIGIMRFDIPNACFDRTNEKGENDTAEVWDIEYGEPTSYEKVAGTERDTAFCVITIDPVARKIYADAFGAGYDRTITY